MMQWKSEIIEFNGDSVVVLPEAVSAKLKVKAGDTIRLFPLFPKERGYLLCTKSQFLQMRTAGKPRRTKRFR
jgi:hypothetical protein